MEITSKIYQIDKTKKYIKKNNLFFLFNGVNCNSIDWLIIDQNFKLINFKYQKVVNKNINKAVEKSIYCNINTATTGLFFFIKPNKEIKFIPKKTLFNKFESFNFTLLALKLNNKIYSVKNIKQINFLDYTENNLLLFQSLNVNLKFCSIKLKKSK